MKLIYICSPLKGETLKNLENAKKYCQIAVDKGYVPIAPHLFLPSFFPDGIPKKREIGIQAGLEILARCDEVWVCGSIISEGMKQEIAKAEAINKPVIQISEREIDISVLGIEHCIINSNRMDYEGKFLIMKPEVLREEYRNERNQIWKALYGFGCYPNAIGRMVHALCLNDGEESNWQRDHFLGIADLSKLPDWAKEEITELEQESEVAERE